MFIDAKTRWNDKSLAERDGYKSKFEKRKNWQRQNKRSKRGQEGWILDPGWLANKRRNKQLAEDERKERNNDSGKKEIAKAQT